MIFAKEVCPVSKLVQVPIGEIARRIAEAICRRLDETHGKRDVASGVRGMLAEAVHEIGYRMRRKTPDFSLGI
mgnify:CR=1 FL=1